MEEEIDPVLSDDCVSTKRSIRLWSKMERITEGVGLGRINLLNYAKTDEFIPSFLGLDSFVTTRK